MVNGECWCLDCTEVREKASTVVRVREDGKDPYPPSAREELLDEAKSLVTGERNNQYGPPHQDFQRTADALTAMGYRRLDAQGDARELQAHDVAIALAMVKISRITWTPGKRDSWADLAGYAACGWECVTEEQKEAA
jgi:hypothetical protein